MNIIRKTTVALGVVVTVLVLEGTGWSQCAMCRTALENSVEGRAIAEGFRYGIVFLLVVPYAIAGSIGVGVFKAFRKKKNSTDPTS
jgi:hypothetical protein